jgi:uncharacterized metal-binding protein
MLFGGLMFGPDLDIHSKQYSRWGPFRFFWLPYRAVFRHRSRWSHGIVFGTLIRVVYSILMLVLLVVGALYLRAFINAEASPPDLNEIAIMWTQVFAGAAAYGFDMKLFCAVFVGLWWGAASHTLTDVAWSVVRKGSEIF